MTPIRTALALAAAAAAIALTGTARADAVKPPPPTASEIWCKKAGGCAPEQSPATFVTCQAHAHLPVHAGTSVHTSGTGECDHPTHMKLIVTLERVGVEKGGWSREYYDTDWMTGTVTVPCVTGPAVAWRTRTEVRSDGITKDVEYSKDVRLGC